MPRKYYRRKKKRTYRKKPKSTILSTRNITGVKSFPMGKRFRTTTRYCTHRHQLNPGIGGLPATLVFSLNSLYDPDTSGVGHQALGFDQFIAMYDHYTVTNARARILFTNTDVTYAQYGFCYIKDSAITTTDFNQIIENGMCRVTTLSEEGGNSSNRELAINVNCHKFFNQNVLNEENYAGGASSSPSDQVYLHVGCMPVVSIDSQAVHFTIIIEYDVVFHEPKQLGTS